jgi:hypothetical protein
MRIPQREYLSPLISASKASSINISRKFSAYEYSPYEFSYLHEKSSMNNNRDFLYIKNENLMKVNNNDNHYHYNVGTVERLISTKVIPSKGV